MKNCKECKTEIGERNKSGFCKLCYSRDYKIRNKEKIKPVKRKYYKKNRDHILSVAKEWHKKNNYAYFKSGKPKENNLVRRKTRYKYPLEGNTCQFCSNAAEHRHHTTQPIEIDKFIFLCKKHHNELEDKSHYDAYEVADVQ